MIILYFLSIFFIITTITEAGPSQRGKCALECYARCMQSGTPSGVYCNCPVEKTRRTCSSVEEKLMSAEIVATVPAVSSEYVDAHTIHLQMKDHPGAFAYIFEYSTISTQPDDWFFAGSSVNPAVTFTVLDPCRDYQFRVIVVIRSTDPREQFVVYRPRAIPVQLPPFVIETEQISVEAPTLNTSTDSLKVFVRWSLPRGYSDSDIYGYEAPALYPIQCRTPEEELPQPKIEIVRAGGRLAVNLPSSVLEGRCRLWVEVRMLPRCIRLEPYSIQKNIEIDCDRNPTLEICSREANPVCTDIIDVWGRAGKAKIAWEAPLGKKPIYYHVRYGPAQMKGTAPFVTWQLATKRDVKVEGAVTTLDVDIPEDQDYGVQVCAILTEQRKRPKFGVIRVTPLQCTSCKNTPSHSVGRCGECGKIEGSTVSAKSWAVGPRPIAGVTTKSADSKTIPALNNNPNKTTSPTVYRMETDLVVASANKKTFTDSTNDEQKKKTSLSEPVPLERAVEINNQDQTTRTSTEQTTTTTTAEATSSSKSEMTSTTTKQAEEVRVVEVGADLRYPSEKRTIESIVPPSMKEKNEDEAKEVVEGEAKEDSREEGTMNETGKTKKDDEKEEKREEKDDRVELPKELNETIVNLEKALEVAEMNGAAAHVDVSADEIAHEEERPRQTGKEGPARDTELYDQAENRGENDLVPMIPHAAEIHVKGTDVQAHGTKLHTPGGSVLPKANKCMLSNGIVCEFGCDSKKICLCPSSTHSVTSSTGACVPLSLRPAVCLPRRDINATWDPVTLNILVHSADAGELLRTVTGTDKLFVEFGRVRADSVLIESGELGQKGQNDRSRVMERTLVFKEEDRLKMVVGTESLIRSATFFKEPFVFNVKDSIDIESEQYGMRLCTFNSSIIKDPYHYHWDGGAVSDHTSSNIIEVVQLSAVHFTNNLQGDFMGDSYWNAFFNIGKITLLVVLVLIMGLLIYLNCSRIKTLYDRKRTHYFRPYYIDPQVQVTSSSRYPGLQRTDLNSYYDVRTRVI